MLLQQAPLTDDNKTGASTCDEEEERVYSQRDARERYRAVLTSAMGRYIGVRDIPSRRNTANWRCKPISFGGGARVQAFFEGGFENVCFQKKKSQKDGVELFYMLYRHIYRYRKKISRVVGIKLSVHIAHP